MTNEQAKDVLLNYTCCCKYGVSPVNCSDEECDFGKAVKTLCERPQGKWIPVSERLPEQGNQSYLVTVDYGNGLVCACQRFFFNSDIGWNDDCVIAWQPLPEPYKKGGAE